MQYEVPQFIDIKDKVFGPLTMNQFLFLAGGLGGVYLSIRFLFFPINYIVAFAVGAGGAYLGFGQYNGRPFPVMLQAMLIYWRRQKLFLWKFRDEVRQSNESVLRSAVAEPTISPAATNNPELTGITVMPTAQPQPVVPASDEKKITKQRLQDIAWGLDVLDKK